MKRTEKKLVKNGFFGFCDKMCAASSWAICSQRTRDNCDNIGLKRKYIMVRVVFSLRYLLLSPIQISGYFLGFSRISPQRQEKEHLYLKPQYKNQTLPLYYTIKNNTMYYLRTYYTWSYDERYSNYDIFLDEGGGQLRSPFSNAFAV